MDARQRAAERRDADADERDRRADEREAKADQRDTAAGEREAKADQRDTAADERDRRADEREAKADLRDTAADEREAKADLRDRELLRESATARLQARLETMPVIEQAKGMIMDQKGCTADQAFDLLCKASQSRNVPVRELATLIVTRNTRRGRNHGQRDSAG